MAETPDAFARALLAAATAVVTETVKVVNKGGLNIKNEARRSVQQTAPVHDAHAAETITYDLKPLGAGAEAEVGYDRQAGRGAAIGNLLEYGGGGDHSPPHRDLGRALDAEEPRFVSALEAISGKALTRGR